VGIDVNPFAIQIARTKALILARPDLLRSPSTVDVLAHTGEAMEEASSQSGHAEARPLRVLKPRQQSLFAETLAFANGRRSRQATPLFEKIGPWFHSETLEQLVEIVALVEAVRPRELRSILRTVFVATLIPASGHRAKKPYGYFADNVIPKTRIYRNAYGLFHRRLLRLVRRCRELEAERAETLEPSLTLAVADARDPAVWKGIKAGAIVTSPPYPGAADYTTAFRLASYWFPDLGAVDDLRTNEIGARWARRRHGTREQYFLDMRCVFDNAVKQLRQGGILALVLPRGRSQTPTIQRLVSDLVQAHPLVEVARLERRILNRHFVRADGGIRSELLLALRKESR
jgi:hypothetical protein